MTANETQDSADLEFTGERFTPEISGQIAFEHLHRYHFARALVAGKAVLDVACGEGYGSDILAQSAASVVGVDIAEDAVSHARARYGSDKLVFVAASAAQLPFADAQFDVVVSFETIEHHDQHEAMISEIRRVLRPGGLLVISSPNKLHYSIEPGYTNPYHVKELFREEFRALIGRYFPNSRLFGQRVVHGSVLISSEDAAGTLQAFENVRLKDGELVRQADLSAPLYDLIVASDGQLPELHSSLFEATVHGMDPAGFYGVHLPERVNVADNRIAQLDQELGRANDTRGHLERLDGSVAAVEGRLEGLDGSVAAVGARLESVLGGLDLKLAEILDARAAEQLLATDIRRLGSELDSTLEHLDGLQKKLQDAENRMRADEELLGQVNRELGSVQEKLEVAENQARADAESLAHANRQIEIRDARLREIHDSTSWRSTAWLRAIGNMVRGGKR